MSVITKYKLLTIGFLATLLMLLMPPMFIAPVAADASNDCTKTQCVLICGDGHVALITSSGAAYNPDPNTYCWTYEGAATITNPGSSEASLCNGTSCKLTCLDGTHTTIISDGATYSPSPTTYCKKHSGVAYITNSNGLGVSSMPAPNTPTTSGCTGYAVNPSSKCPVTNIADPATQCNQSRCDLVTKYVNPAINLVAIIVGLVVTAGIIFGAIQYSTSGGDPQKAAKAKDHITNAVIGLVAFVFLYAFLQWIVPGGLLH